MSDTTSLTGHSILIFAGSDYEDLELWYPKLRLEEAGASTVLAGPEAETTYLGKHGYPCESEISLDDLTDERLATFTGVVCPGGWMPDKLRRYETVLNAVRSMHQRSQLVAAICHGGWIPISAGVYSGVKVTGSPGIKDDLINAGAEWEDAPVTVDRHFVSSRRPGDLPDFCRAMIEVLEKQGT